MPSIFTLDGARFGAGGLVPSIFTSVNTGIPVYPKKVKAKVLGTLPEYARQHRPPSQGQLLAGAVSTGFGELSQNTKTGLIILGALGLVSVVALGGMRRAMRRFRGLRGGRRVYAEHVRINRGGYDSGGRYWGIGERLYRVSDGEDLDRHVRAPSAAEARRKVTGSSSGLQGTRRRKRRR